MRKIILLTLCIMCSSLQAQGYDTIQFDQILKNHSAHELFIKKIVSKDRSMYQDENGKTYTAIETFEKFEETNYVTLLPMRRIDQNGVETIFGKIYIIDRYSQYDNKFKYDQLNFNRFALYANLKDEIVGVRLTNDYADYNSVKIFVQKFSSQYKTDVVESHSGNKEFHFNLNDKTIRLIEFHNNNVIEVSPALATPIIQNEEENSKKIKIDVVILFKGLDSNEKNFFNKNLNFQLGNED